MRYFELKTGESAFEIFHRPSNVTGTSLCRHTTTKILNSKVATFL